MYKINSFDFLNISSHDCSRLRLAAACGILKVAQEIHYDEVIPLEHFQQLALTMQVIEYYIN
jgi:hypothetical protein